MGSLADMLRSAAGDVQQKVIVARSGIGSDQVSKILSGETKDPRWSTMVALLRDGLGVSLDAFVGGQAATPITLYDSNVRYRQIVDALERLPKRERETVLGFFEWALVRDRLPDAVSAPKTDQRVDSDANQAGSAAWKVGR
jgi:transcriptional regulator with XRE-family HTH domain